MLRFFLIILFLITAIVIFFTQTQPYYKDIKTLIAERDEYQVALVDSRELQTLRDQLLSQYNTISQDDFNRLGKILPVSIDSGSIIVMFEDRARENGILLKKIDVIESKESTSDSTTALGALPLPYKTVGLSFSISGSYASVLSFFSDLEKNLRLIDIKSISFSSSPSDIYEFNVSAKTYFTPVSPLTAVADTKKSEGTKEILSMLTKLRAVKIDTDFFSGDIYKSLVDFLPVLEMPKEYGRPNPFILPPEAATPIKK
ncbi:MAG: hypothetical protein CO056_00820 [Candidatus Tagabacteria bacterium CG_4_9_14_0_2_um_filter_41_11]|uniref:Uncharacterized protein n=1 Tax=Candidatus Tagabacteria bacterium CG_4_9_14_0_2_um_filter_41_11 TaxID=1975019 RepID=A0A2M8ERG6_9BACT|nr:MAG: hypothetical protein CO056_00820 [Candidatus Tagabacteria bacterium CG_4_9_14_0_2_um_filter_41_11]